MPDKIYDAVKTEFAARGCYFLDPDETEKVRKTIIINGALNAKIVGQKAATIAELAGISVPASTKILIGEVESVEITEEFAHEKLSPVLAMYRVADIDEAFGKAEKLIEDGGYGHTAAIYLDPIKAKDTLDKFSERMKTCRILVNTPSSHGGIGDLYNFKLADCAAYVRLCGIETVSYTHLTFSGARNHSMFSLLSATVLMLSRCFTPTFSETELPPQLPQPSVSEGASLKL